MMRLRLPLPLLILAWLLFGCAGRDVAADLASCQLEVDAAFRRYPEKGRANCERAEHDIAASGRCKPSFSLKCEALP